MRGDPITVFIATGLRISELLALRWQDYDSNTGMLTVSGKVVRVKGEGLGRFDDGKSDAGLRMIPLPRFAVEALDARRSRPFVGKQEAIFASTAGTLRDPANFTTQWAQCATPWACPRPRRIPSASRWPR